jgi:hypothetical protein
VSLGRQEYFNLIPPQEKAFHAAASKDFQRFPPAAAVVATVDSPLAKKGKSLPGRWPNVASIVVETTFSKTRRKFNQKHHKIPTPWP